MTRLAPLTINRRRATSLVPDVRNGWRAVSDERARKLRRRGETVEWRPQLDSMAWLPGGRPATCQIMECPGCGWRATSLTIEFARIDYDCPCCEIFTIADFVPAFH